MPNDAGAHYPVAGAYAMILNNIIRATEDVDILIEDSPENFRKVIDGLSGLVDGAAKEPVPEDFLENIVVKTAVVDGISIPYLSLPDLIRNKLTYRDQDRVDVERLRRLLP